MIITGLLRRQQPFLVQACLEKEEDYYEIRQVFESVPTYKTSYCG